MKTKRSADYRYQFIRKNKGLGNRKYYHCAYCGKIVKKDRMQVDHIIPVNKVKGFGVGRLCMILFGIHNINDPKNLTSACEKCNKKKSDKMGGWIIRGFIGKHFWVWIIRYILRIALVLFLTWVIWRLVRGEDIFGWNMREFNLKIFQI